MIERKVTANRQQIISEYLSGKESYQALQNRYGVKARTIQTWVRAYRKQHPSAIHKATEQNSPQQIAVLEKQLDHARLKNALLEEMLRLAEQHTGIDMRKKYGTRQS